MEDEAKGGGASAATAGAGDGGAAASSSSTADTADTAAPAFGTEDTISVLLVSDVHNAVQRIVALGAWMRANANPPVSCILALGDLADVSTADQAVPAKVHDSEGDMSSVLAGLEDISARTAYIPGNHDPVTAFDRAKPPRLSTHSLNFHGRYLRLAPGLVVAGLGGSVPAYRDGKQVWSGFPYTESDVKGCLGMLLRHVTITGEAEADADADAVVDAKAEAEGAPWSGAAVDVDADVGNIDAALARGKGFEAARSEAAAAAGGGGGGGGGSAAGTAKPWTICDRPGPEDTIVLATHCGPADCATAVDSSKLHQSPVQTGSTELRAAMETEPVQRRVIANLHGHTHRAAGQAWVGEVPVVNPGSLRYGGRFAIMTFRRSKAGGAVTGGSAAATAAAAATGAGGKAREAAAEAAAAVPRWHIASVDLRTLP